MNDTRDVDAADWLHQSLQEALYKVKQRQFHVDEIRVQLDEANAALGEAVALADAIRLIISMAPLPLVAMTAAE